ncbi:MAG: RNA polymerase sigma factor [Ruminiclostridium sp.]
MKEEKFTHYISLFQSTVFRVAYSYVKNRADAEDIMQEVFLLLYKSEENFAADENAKAWLIRTAANRAKNHLKSRWVKGRNDITEDFSFETREDRELLLAVNRLNKNYRIVIYLFYYEGYGVKEISAMLGISETNVKARLKRGRDKLKTLLEE